MDLSKKKEEKEWDAIWGDWAVCDKTEWGGESCQVEYIFQEEWESDTTQSLNQFFVKAILYIILVGIWFIRAWGACAGDNQRERNLKVSNDIAQVVPTPTRDVPVRVENPLGWTGFQIDWAGLQRVSPNPNPTPTLPLGSIPPIERSPQDEKDIWTGNLSLGKLKDQYLHSFVLKDQGEQLRFQLHQLDANHHLLTPETYKTLSGRNLRATIAAEETRRKRLVNSVPDFTPVRFQVSETILEEYHKWCTCADTLSTTIKELSRPKR